MRAWLRRKKDLVEGLMYMRHGAWRYNCQQVIFAESTEVKIQMKNQDSD